MPDAERPATSAPRRYSLNWRLTMFAPMALLQVIEGVICLCTFTLWMPKWSLSYGFWRSKKEARRGRSN